MPLQVRYGELLDVIGHPVRFEGCTFVPADVRLNGLDGSPEYDFTDWCSNSGKSIPLIVNRDTNAPWILGRLIKLFNSENTREDERGEKCCFSHSFLAVHQDWEDVGIPFEVSDAYGRTSLWFSDDDAPPLDLRTLIANAFYGLLLDEPDAIADYENCLFHTGAGVWIDFGVSCGEPYMVERTTEFD